MAGDLDDLGVLAAQTGQEPTDRAHTTRPVVALLRRARSGVRTRFRARARRLGIQAGLRARAVLRSLVGLRALVGFGGNLGDVLRRAGSVLCAGSVLRTRIAVRGHPFLDRRRQQGGLLRERADNLSRGSLARTATGPLTRGFAR
ncbi:hypothetical protein ACG83_14325 [Frankia sp. R43]|nr:hypothetical protein ACG83_14325 [Frankia sp. R43]